MARKKLKTLASCKPSEFLKQTNRIRKAAEKWLNVTDIMHIREDNKPKLKMALPDSSDVEKQRIEDENQKIIKEQAKANFSKILDVIMDEHPDETLELLALCCFVEPENVDDYPVSMYLEAFGELINDEAVLNFFMSSIQLVQSLT